MINATDYGNTTDGGGGGSRSSSVFMLKVKETNEYLHRDSLLKDFEYVHQCLKYSRDHIDFVLVQADSIQRPFQRTVSACQQVYLSLKTIYLKNRLYSLCIIAWNDDLMVYRLFHASIIFVSFTFYYQLCQ